MEEEHLKTLDCVVVPCKRLWYFVQQAYSYILL